MPWSPANREFWGKSLRDSGNKLKIDYTHPPINETGEIFISVTLDSCRLSQKSTKELNQLRTVKSEQYRYPGVSKNMDSDSGWAIGRSLREQCNPATSYSSWRQILLFSGLLPSPHTPPPTRIQHHIEWGFALSINRTSLSGLSLLDHRTMPQTPLVEASFNLFRPVVYSLHIKYKNISVLNCPFWCDENKSAALKIRFETREIIGRITSTSLTTPPQSHKSDFFFMLWLSSWLMNVM